jgi:hypothetical protein
MVASEAIRLTQEAFFRELPEMLQNPKLRGKWVAYHRGQRVNVGARQRDRIDEVNRLDLTDDDVCTFIIEPQSPEPEEVDFPSSWL